MDEQRIRQIIREVLQRVSEEDAVSSDTNASLLPKAYFIFPENWQSCGQESLLAMLKAADGRYEKVIVLSKRGENSEDLSVFGAQQITFFSDLCAPVEGSITVYPCATRDLVIKTALCLSDDFESNWIRQCIERGLPVYLKKETEMFTGKEPAAYRKKILSYYQDVKSYGIQLIENSLCLDAGPKSGGESCVKQRKARYITTQDLRDVPENGTFEIRNGDVLTALAKDHIEKFGIRVIEG